MKSFGNFCKQGVCVCVCVFVHVFCLFVCLCVCVCDREGGKERATKSFL